jgi:WD40 repeat protein
MILQLANRGVLPDIAIFETSTWSEYRTMEGHKESIRGVKWAPDGSLLASWSESQVLIWSKEMDTAPVAK